MGDTGCVNPHCPEKLLPRIAAQERELAALRRVRDAAVKMRLLDDRTADSYVTGAEWSQAWNALRATLESEAGDD